MEECAQMCQKVDACKWWTWGDEDAVKKCWIRTGRHGREKRYGFSSGARGCFPGISANSTEDASISSESSADGEGGTEAKAEDSNVNTQPRRMMSLEESEPIRAQPRRLSDFGDLDFGLGSGRPYSSFGGLNPHMPIFGMGYDSKENQLRKEQRGESCRVYGHFETNKVPGNFHIGTHGTIAPSYLSYFDEPAPKDQNMRHTVNHLAFVDVISNKTLAEKQPLDGFESPKAFTFQYYITVNPATIKGKGFANEGYQYRAGSFVTNELIGPAVFFRYEIDPIRVTYFTEKVTLTTWLTNMCAVIGGCIALSAMLEQLVEAAIATALSKE